MDYHLSSSMQFYVAAVDLCNDSRVHFRMRSSYCKKLSYMLAAICHLCGPSHAQVIQNNRVRKLVDFKEYIDFYRASLILLVYM